MQAIPLAERRKRCEEHLLLCGLDLHKWFRLGDLNARLSDEERISGGSDALGVLVGNSRALWEPFVSWVHRTAPESEHPLDLYVEETVRRVAHFCGEISWIRFAHELDPAPIPIQRYAHLLGLAHLGPAHLSVHEQHGPWIGLRAIVVFTESGPKLPISDAPVPCARCQAPCEVALQAAIDARDLPRDFTEILPPAQLSEVSQRFLRVRDVCPVGTSSRYSDNQIVYHYDKDERSLVR